MKYDAKLYNSIKDFAADRRTSFHMPVHGGGKLYEDEFCKNIMKLDVTELDATDNLAAPEGEILKMHENMATLFKAQNAHVLVGGSSAGNHAMILSCVRPGDKLLVDRCVHTSVVNACVIYGIVPVFIEREIRQDFSVNAPLSPEELANVTKNHPDAKAVLITTPTYYGICSPVRELADIAHAHSMAMLVDCAHGSHSAFCDDFPSLPTLDGADMCVISLHKTLGAPTQTALLLHNSERISFERVKKCINMVHTTSPSYMLMCAADVICEKMARDGEVLYKKAAELTLYAKRCIENETACICLPEKGGDMTRLVINFAEYDITGEAVAKALSKKYKIDVEMADCYNIVCIIGPMTEEEEINALVSAVKKILQSAGKRNKKSTLLMQHTAIFMSQNPSHVFFDEGDLVDIAKSAGRICAETVSIYPPGEVCLVPGAEITKDVAENILRAKEEGRRVTGLSGNFIRVAR